MSTNPTATLLSNDLSIPSQQLMASIGGIFWEADIQTLQFIYVSKQAEILLGYPCAAWLTPGFWAEHMHPADREWAVDYCMVAIRQNRSHTFEYRMIAADGRVVWLRDVVTVIREEEKAGRLCGIMVDVSEQKQAEEELSNTQRQLFTLVDNFPDFIVRFDRDGRILYLNPASVRSFGIPANQLVGKTLHELAQEPVEKNDYLVASIRRAFDQNCVDVCESSYLLPSGIRYYEIRHIPELDRHGNVVSVLGITRDVTDERQAEAERQAHLWFLESLDKVNRALQGTNDLEEMVNDVLDVVLAIFGCDRAWLLNSHEPTSPLWSPPMERSRPGYPCTYSREVAILTFPEMSNVLQIAHAAGVPVSFAPGEAQELSAQVREFLDTQSTLVMSLYPKDDQPYLFGLHQCTYARRWTPQEQRLFQELGRRLGDALTSLLAYRRLHESERRYREVFENTSDVIVIAEVTEIGRLRFLDFNPAWEALMAIERTPLLGRELEEFAEQPLIKTLLPYYQSALQLKTPLSFDAQFVTPTGHWYTHVTLIPICGSDGQVYRIVSVGRNVTEQKLAEDELRTSEARFRTFVDHATDAFFLHDEFGMILDVNRQACISLGYTRDELIGMSPLRLDRALTRDRLEQIHTCLDSGEVLIFEASHERKDGSTFPVEVSIRAFWMGQQRFAISLSRDIRERKRLAEAFTLFRTLIDQANDIIEVIDPATSRFLDVNERACTIHGYTREEYLQLLAPAVNPDLVDRSWSELMANLQKRGSLVYESRHRRKDGTEFPVEVNATYIRLDRDYVVLIVRDISQRKQVQAALQESEERYRTLYDANPTMYFTLDTQGIILSVNPFGAEYLGYTIDELMGSSVLGVFYDEDKASAFAHVQQCLEHPNQHFHWSLRKVRKDGTLLWVEETARAVYTSAQTLVLLIVCEDITERKRTEQALLESHSILNGVIEGMADAVFVKDLQGRYILINRAGAELFGRQVEEIIGQDDFVLFPADGARKIQELDRLIMRSGEAHIIEEVEPVVTAARTFLTTKTVYRDAQGAVIGLIGISRDITELKRLEAQFRQAQKMDALGRLAGGVAHDFNNLLTVINGYSQLLFKRLAADGQSHHLVGEVIKASNRAAGLTRQLLAFSRKQVLQPQLVNLNQLLTELVAMLRRLIGENIELSWRPEPNLGWTKIDPGQFEQAIINLVVNARDAMPQGGRLTIETHTIEFTPAYAEQYQLRTTPYACVTVIDTGSGMDDLTKTRLFEPFFTTKGPGKGTGLGLAMVYGFIKQSDGHIEVASELGHGATFRIYFPLVEPPPFTQSTTEPAHTTLDGTETILLVEDETSVRELVADILRDHDYRVLEAEDPQKALTIAHSYEGTIQLLLTDVIMPQMDGRKLSQQIIAIRSELKVLYMSGYTENIIDTQELTGKDGAFLQKPFTVDGLLQKVRKILGD